MKKNNLSLFLLFSLCISLKIDCIELHAATKASNGQTALDVKYDATYNESYYLDISGKSKKELLEGLAKISNEHHFVYNDYESLKGATCFSDDDYNDDNTNYLVDFYTGWATENIWNSGNTWNREHVWCQKNSNGLYGESKAGSDLHHLRPSISTLNNIRNNRLFSEVEHIDENKLFIKNASEWTGCYYTSKYFEPSIDKRGDVARILMYVYMHYSTEVNYNITNHTDYSGDLTITNIIQASSTDDNSEQASWDLLLKWNKLDPVDALEKQRNDYCASTLGLRNPFIDHQEFADMIWDSSYSGSGALLDTSYTLDDYLTLTVSKKTLDIGQNYKINPNSNVDETISYISSDPTIASVNDEGLISALNAGSTTISVSLKDMTRTFNVTVNSDKKVDGTWSLVKDDSSLKANDTIIIAALNENMALNTNQDTNNRKASKISKENNKENAIFDDSVQQIVLENGSKENTFAFNVDNKYLYAASSTANHLKSQNNIDDNASFTISINSTTGSASIISQGTNAKNTLRYNSASLLFSCYASGQQDICIYRKNKEDEKPIISDDSSLSNGNDNNESKKGCRNSLNTMLVIPLTILLIFAKKKKSLK